MRTLAQYLNLEEAVDYLIDKTPEGAPFRDGTDPLGFSGKKYLDPPVGRQYFAARLIVRACRDGRWKASGKKPGSPEREHIPDIHFIGSVISSTGDLMAEPGPTSTSLSRHPSRKVAIWTQLMFSVPGGANEGEAADTKGGHVGRRPASQSQAEKIWEAFDERQNALTFNRGELARIAGEIGEAIGYKQNSVEKIIRPKYRDLEPKKKQNPT